MIDQEQKEFNRRHKHDGVESEPISYADILGTPTAIDSQVSPPMERGRNRPELRWWL
jgi:hypothetical protein